MVNEKRVDRMVEFFKMKPSYIDSSFSRISERSNEFDINIVNKGKIKYRDFLKKEKLNKVGIHVVVGCNHYPWANMEQEKAILNLIKDLGNKIKGFHILGDFLDMNSLSKHSPNELPIPGITLGYEYKSGNEALDRFEEVLPENCEKTYLFGNHEDRYFRHMKNIDASKLGEALLSPREALKLDYRGYKVYENWKEDRFLIGKHLYAFHGEFTTKYPARTHLDKQKISGIFVHTHRMDVAFDGELRAMFNIGFCGDKEAPCFKYVSRHIRDSWVNGFALVHIDEEGNYYTQVIQMFNNKFCYNGKIY